jgi:hypothetical protein
MILRYSYFALQTTVTVKHFRTVKLNSISEREIRHQRVNNHPQTVLVRGKIAGPGRAGPGRAEDICLHQGCHLRGFLKNQILGFF